MRKHFIYGILTGVAAVVAGGAMITLLVMKVQTLNMKLNRFAEYKCPFIATTLRGNRIRSRNNRHVKSLLR